VRGQLEVVQAEARSKDSWKGSTPGEAKIIASWDINSSRAGGGPNEQAVEVQPRHQILAGGTAGNAGGAKGLTAELAQLIACFTGSAFLQGQAGCATCGTLPRHGHS
jgi:hypothetical protein